METEKRKRINIAIDEVLHRELKITAAINGTTIKEYVSKALRTELDKENQKGTKQNEEDK